MMQPRVMTTMFHLLPVVVILATTTMALGQSAIGRIVDVRGEPIPAALVQVVVDGKTVARSYADGEGIYLIPAMPESGATLRIGARGKASTELQWRGHRTPRVRNATLRDAGKLHGRVTEQTGQPIAGVDVIAVFGNDSLRTQTDGSGDYILDPVPLGRLSVHVWSGERTTQQDLLVTSDTECLLKMPKHQGTKRHVRIRGLPSDYGDGFLSVTSPNLALMPDGGRVPLGADGTAVVHILDMSVVSPRLAGFTTTPRGRLATWGSSSLDFDAKPIGATASNQRITGQLLTTVGKVVRAEQLYFHDQSGLLLATAMVDRGGTFSVELPYLSAGMYRIAMPLDRWEFADSQSTLRDGFSWVPLYASDDSTRLLVQRTRIVNCIVSDSNDTLLPLAEVTIVDPHRPQLTIATTACDRTGHLFAALPEADYELLAVTHDGRLCLGKAEVVDNREELAVTWQTLATGTVTGTVVSSEGLPMPGIEMFVASQEIRNRRSVHAASRQSVRVFTDRHGHFRCRALPPGDYTVVALNTPEIPSTTFAIRADAETNVPITAQN